MASAMVGFAGPAASAESEPVVTESVAELSESAPLAPRPLGPFFTVNLDNAKTIAIRAGSRADGAVAVQWDATAGGGDNDKMIWEEESTVPGDLTRLKPLHTYSADGNPHNDMCLAVEGASMAAGARIVQARCTYDGINNDVWWQEQAHVYGMQFRNQRSGLCIAVKGASDANGAQIIQYTCNGTLNSVWRGGLT